MLDIKLKKFNNKLNTIVVLLTVLIPSIVLVSLYPKMGKIYEKELDAFNAEVQQEKEENMALQGQDMYYVSDTCINYLVEASYYLYGQMLQAKTGEPVNFSVLDEYGWINDYYTVNEDTLFYAELLDNGVIVQSKSNTEDKLEVLLPKAETDIKELKELFEDELTEHVIEDEASTSLSKEDVLKKVKENDEYIGYMTMEYDQFGNLSEVRYHSFYENGSDVNEHLYAHAKQSFDQYIQNVNYYNEVEYEKVDVAELHPKNFRAVYLVKQNSIFSYGEYVEYACYTYWSESDIYYNMGVWYVIFGFAVLVGLVALILPFFKKVDAGKGRFSNLSLETCMMLGAIDLLGVYTMFHLMSITSMRYIQDNLPKKGTIDIVGLEYNAGQIYVCLLMIAFVGWLVVYTIEYFCVISIRKFFESPKAYVHDKILCVRFIRWCIRITKRFFDFVFRIDMNHKAHGFILKFVLLQVFVMVICCVFWYVGWFGALAYGILLYFVMRKTMKRICDEYQTILCATKKMAEGDLKFEVKTNLQEFKELGNELQLVQEGFSKAVMEEAKSQNMKTELITNVSHDLKTPLTAIITYVDLLKRENNTEEERAEYIATLEKKSQRLKILIEDLFEVSKATTNNITMNFADVDIVNLIKQVRLENEDKIEAADLEFYWNMPREKWILSLDPNRTYRVIDNLIQNVLKYAMPKSRVYVDMNSEEEYVVFQIKNMSAVAMNFDANEITERFVRGDLSRNTEGSGLGLAIARSFTELQNGKFNIEIDGDLFKVTVRFKK